MHRKARIYIKDDTLIIATPYHEEFVYDLKQIVPISDRSFDPDTKNWIVTDLALGDDVAELIQDYFDDYLDGREPA